MRPEKKRIKDLLKVYLKTLQITPTTFGKSGIDRNLWLITLHDAAIPAEERRMADVFTALIFADSFEAAYKSYFTLIFASFELNLTFFSFAH
jgi:hypothetical protein